MEKRMTVLKAYALGRKTQWSLLIGLCAALLIPAAAFALPAIVTQEGVVMTNDGVPDEGVHDIRVRLYETSDAILPFFD